MTAKSIITLLTDFGSDSPYVAAMKGVVLTINPAAMIVDITHRVPPQDIRAGAFVLGQVCSRFPAGTLHVAVVDPGVGTERGLVYLEVGQQRFVGPDNGLFSRVASGAAKIHALENRSYWLPEVSSTFHGRDIMAPVAAHLSLGLDAERLGPRVPSLVPFEWPQPRIEQRRMIGEIQAIDTFGNLITNISETDLDQIPQRGTARITCGGHRISGICRTYGDCSAGTLVALVGSTGYLELAIVNGNARQELGVAVSVAVRVEW